MNMMDANSITMIQVCYNLIYVSAGYRAKVIFFKSAI